MTFTTSHFNTGMTFKCVITVYKPNKEHIIYFKNTAILKMIKCDWNLSPLGSFPIEDLEFYLVSKTFKALRVC